MMDVKNTAADGTASITTMLAKHAIDRNHEMKELLKEPVREENSKVQKADDDSQKSADSSAEKDKDNELADPSLGVLVNVNV